MAVMTDRQSVAANAVVANACSGKLHEFLPSRAMVRLYALGSAVGLNMTLQVAGVTILNDQEVGVGTAMPIVPDNFVCETPAPPGARVVLTYRNTTGGAITAYSRVDVIPF